VVEVVEVSPEEDGVVVVPDEGELELLDEFELVDGLEAELEVPAGDVLTGATAVVSFTSSIT
jgi:hypothetical protein